MTWEKRTIKKELSLTPSEFKRWTAAAKQLGLTVSDYIRLAVNRTITKRD